MHKQCHFPRVFVSWSLWQPRRDKGDANDLISVVVGLGRRPSSRNKVRELILLYDIAELFAQSLVGWTSCRKCQDRFQRIMREDCADTREIIFHCWPNNEFGLHNDDWELDYYSTFCGSKRGWRYWCKQWDDSCQFRRQSQRIQLSPLLTLWLGSVYLNIRLSVIPISDGHNQHPTKNCFLDLRDREFGSWWPDYRFPLSGKSKIIQISDPSSAT